MVQITCPSTGERCSIEWFPPGYGYYRYLNQGMPPDWFPPKGLKYTVKCPKDLPCPMVYAIWCDINDE